MATLPVLLLLGVATTAVCAYTWWPRPDSGLSALEITEADALEHLASGFEWEYEPPGRICFTCEDGNEIVASWRGRPASWTMREPLDE